VICSLQKKSSVAAFSFTCWAELQIPVENSRGGIRTVPVCVARGVSADGDSSGELMAGYQSFAGS